MEIKEGKIILLMVRHDDWCKTMNGGKPEDCTCSPDIEEVEIESEEDWEKYLSECEQ